MVEVTPGESTTVALTDDYSIVISLPKEELTSADDFIRGITISDPCFTSEYIGCAYKDSFDTFNGTTLALNTIFKHSDVHYWSILGDNFYDQSGLPSKSWFTALSKDVKSQPLLTVPGNHDYWVHGSPSAWTNADQLGNGFMQFYGQDTASSISNFPYDFSIDPEASAAALPVSDNFFFYNKIGNQMFIGYSGAYVLDDLLPRMKEACSWAQETNPAIIMLLGHWNSDNDGCADKMATGELYQYLTTTVKECQPLASKFRYMEGHKHCNIVMEADIGFMIGANGMADGDASCTGTYGFSVTETSMDKFSIYYFELRRAGPGGKIMITDNYDEIISCIDENGVSGCYQYAKVWSSKVF